MLIVHDCPLWKNDDIGRELSQEGIKSVMNDFVKRYVATLLKMWRRDLQL